MGNAQTCQLRPLCPATGEVSRGCTFGLEIRPVACGRRRARISLVISPFWQLQKRQTKPHSANNSGASGILPSHALSYGVLLSCNASARWCGHTSPLASAPRSARSPDETNGAERLCSRTCGCRVLVSILPLSFEWHQVREAFLRNACPTLMLLQAQSVCDCRSFLPTLLRLEGTRKRRLVEQQGRSVNKKHGSFNATGPCVTVSLPLRPRMPVSMSPHCKS
jgi:hypothetical protein